jgi:hypothetical protein
LVARPFSASVGRRGARQVFRYPLSGIKIKDMGYGTKWRRYLYIKLFLMYFKILLTFVLQKVNLQERVRV